MDGEGCVQHLRRNSGQLDAASLNRHIKICPIGYAKTPITDTAPHRIRRYADLIGNSADALQQWSD